MQEIQPENGVVDDFSFVCLNPDGSPISAEDAFVNGQIRPVFPMFDQRILTDDGGFTVKETTTSVRPQLKNLFMEDRSRVSPETYCEWLPQKAEETAAPAPELGKKSYSTGFSKLWRFGEKSRRSSSSSDGKETFVFVRSASSGSGEKAAEKNRKDGKVKGAAKGKGETASYYHERLYARNEMNKRKSYLPYRSNLMGFFTAPNGLNRIS